MRQWFKSLDDLGKGFAILGVLLVGVGNALNINILLYFGLALLGAGATAWGVNALQSREIGLFQEGISLAQRVREFLARVWSLFLVAAGLLLLGYGILSALYPRSPLVPEIQQFFSSPPGTTVLILCGSVIGMLVALGIIFADEPRGDHEFGRLLSSLPSRIFGVMLLILCGAVGTIRLVQIFAPGVWENLWHAFLRQIGVE